MSAGTLTLTNNSAAVAGSGTAFTTELAAGDFIVVTVGGVPYTLPVKTVNSNTSATLVSNFTGPTQSGAAWSAVPRVALNMVTAALVAQSAEALRGLNYDKQNWQQFFTADGDVTITLPDTSQTTGPSAKKLINSVSNKADKTALNDYAKKGANDDITSLGGLTTALSVAQGGTGAKTAADARGHLELGNSATRNIVDSPASLTTDAVLVPGYRGIGLPSLGGGGGDTVSIYQNFNGSGFYTIDGSRVTSLNIPSWWHPSASGSVWGGGVYISRTQVQVIEFLASRDGKAGIRVRRDSTVDPVQAEFYTTLNTTKASDGALKAASPVARIVNSQDDNQRIDVAEDGFIWCGCGTSNAEAEGITLSRLDVGVYVLTGSAGLASSGWQLLPPMDPGGMGELGIVDAEQTESGVLTIRLFRRKYMLAEDGEMIKTKGEPIDVPSNSWIDVRLDMPDNSAWNHRQKEVMDAAEDESGS